MIVCWGCLNECLSVCHMCLCWGCLIRDLPLIKLTPRPTTIITAYIKINTHRSRGRSVPIRKYYFIRFIARVIVYNINITILIVGSNKNLRKRGRKGAQKQKKPKSGGNMIKDLQNDAAFGEAKNTVRY